MKRWFVVVLLGIGLTGCNAPPSAPPAASPKPEVTSVVEAPDASEAPELGSPPPAADTGWQEVEFEPANVAVTVPDDMPPLSPRPDGWATSSNEHVLLYTRVQPWKQWSDVEKAVATVLQDYKLAGKPTPGTAGSLTYQSEPGIWTPAGQKMNVVVSAWHIHDKDMVLIAAGPALPDLVKVATGVTVQAPESSDCDSDDDAACPASSESPEDSSPEPR